MKRNYKYEKEMLHWLDGGEILQSFKGGIWAPFDGDWVDDPDWQYCIADFLPKLCEDEGCDHYGTEHICNCDSPAAAPKPKRWMYVIAGESGEWVLSVGPNNSTIGKIRMEDV